MSTTSSLSFTRTLRILTTGQRNQLKLIINSSDIKKFSPLLLDRKRKIFYEKIGEPFSTLPGEVMLLINLKDKQKGLAELKKRAIVSNYEIVSNLK